MHELLILLKNGRIDLSGADDNIKQSVELLETITNNYTEPYEDDEFLNSLHKYFLKNNLIQGVQEQTEPQGDVELIEEIELIDKPTLDVEPVSQVAEAQKEEDFFLDLPDEVLSELIGDEQKEETSTNEETDVIADVEDVLADELRTLVDDDIPNLISDVVGYAYSNVRFNNLIPKVELYRLLSKAQINTSPLQGSNINNPAFFGRKDCHIVFDVNPIVETNGTFNAFVYCTDGVNLEKIAHLFDLHSFYDSKDAVTKSIYENEIKVKWNDSLELTSTYAIDDKEPHTGVSYGSIIFNKLLQDKIISNYESWVIWLLYSIINKVDKDSYTDLIDDYVSSKAVLQQKVKIQTLGSLLSEQTFEMRISPLFLDKLKSHSIDKLSLVSDYVILTHYNFPLNFHSAERVFYEIDDIIKPNDQRVVLGNGVFVRSAIANEFYVRDKFAKGVIPFLDDLKYDEEKARQLDSYISLADNENIFPYEKYAFKPSLYVELHDDSETPILEAEFAGKDEHEYYVGGCYLLTNYHDSKSVRVSSLLVNLIDRLPKKESVKRKYFIAKKQNQHRLLFVTDYDTESGNEEIVAMQLLPVDAETIKDISVPIYQDSLLGNVNPNIPFKDWISVHSDFFAPEETPESIEAKQDLPALDIPDILPLLEEKSHPRYVITVYGDRGAEGSLLADTIEQAEQIAASYEHAVITDAITGEVVDTMPPVPTITSQVLPSPQYVITVYGESGVENSFVADTIEQAEQIAASYEHAVITDAITGEVVDTMPPVPTITSQALPTPAAPTASVAKKKPTQVPISKPVKTKPQAPTKTKAKTSATKQTASLKPSDIGGGLTRKHDKVYEAIQGYYGDAWDVQLLQQSLANKLDYYTLEDLLVMGFNLDKWIVNDRVILIPNKYALVRVNSLDYGYYIFDYQTFKRKGYDKL